MCFFRSQMGFGPLGVFPPPPLPPSWLDDQLVNELHRRSVGVLRPPSLSLCVSGCCPIHDSPVKMWCTSFLDAHATPYFRCWFLWVADENAHSHQLLIKREQC